MTGKSNLSTIGRPGRVRFRFTLRGLLGAVTLAAVATAAVSIWYRSNESERRQEEQIVTNSKSVSQAKFSGSDWRVFQRVTGLTFSDDANSAGIFDLLQHFPRVRAISVASDYSLSNAVLDRLASLRHLERVTIRSMINLPPGDGYYPLAEFRQRLPGVTINGEQWPFTVAQ